VLTFRTDSPARRKFSPLRDKTSVQAALLGIYTAIIATATIIILAASATKNIPEKQILKKRNIVNTASEKGVDDFESELSQPLHGQ
jgi:hypothetical protein